MTILLTDLLQAAATITGQPGPAGPPGPLTSPGVGTYFTRTYTGNGTTSTYAVTSGTNVNNVIVTENGVVQTPTTDYTISGPTLTFTTAPASEQLIQIRELFGGPSVSTGTVTLIKGTTAPPGWLLMNGSLVSIEEYPDLVPFLSSVQTITSGTMVSNSIISSSASSYIDVRDSTQAHDGETSETTGGWHSDYENQPWLQFYFNDTVARTINAYRLWGRADGFNIGENGFIVYGSNDGTTFTQISSEPAGSQPPNESFKDYTITSPGAYTYYRIQSNTYYYQVVGEWQLFVGATISTLYKLPENGYGAGNLSWPNGYAYIIKT